jgi:indolepyruvate decarboxylase
LPDVLGGGEGYVVRTEGEFDQALNAAWNARGGPSILQVLLDPDDCSRALTKMAEKMSRTVVQQ